MMTVLTPTKKMLRDFYPLTVSAVDRLCEDAVAITFDVPDELGELFCFRPGQSLTLQRVIDGVDERRSYSICAPAGKPPRVGVRTVPEGVFSSWLAQDVRPGDVISVQPPSGRFCIDPETGGRHVLIASGSGITPVMSIAASLLTNPDTQVTLLYGNRRTNSVMFADELADLKDRYRRRFELIHVLSREPRDVELFSGRLDAQRVGQILQLLVPVPAVDGFWLCGPFGMVEDLWQLLGDLGVSKQQLHTELFFVESAPPPPAEHLEPEMQGPSSTASITLDGKTTTVTLPRNERVLDAAQRSRPDLPFACKGGVCGTCRAKLVSGNVEMVRNYALEDSELEAGYVLTCQSLPRSDELTIDYDA